RRPPGRPPAPPARWSCPSRPRPPRTAWWRGPCGSVPGPLRRAGGRWARRRSRRHPRVVGLGLAEVERLGQLRVAGQGGVVALALPRLAQLDGAEPVRVADLAVDEDRRRADQRRPRCEHPVLDAVDDLAERGPRGLEDLVGDVVARSLEPTPGGD